MQARFIMDETDEQIYEVYEAVRHPKELEITIPEKHIAVDMVDDLPQDNQSDTTQVKNLRFGSETKRKPLKMMRSQSAMNYYNPAALM